MRTTHGHLSYCTNIHSGESWISHFESIRKFVPQIKAEVSAGAAFGIGLRLSNEASLELVKENSLAEFRLWLAQEDCYVFTMNGFPYGGFHHTVVKDAVHKPDWTTPERLAYTIRLASILAALLPAGLDGGISTSPLSYRHWFASEEEKSQALAKGTENVLQVVKKLVRLKKTTGKTIHLDIEPEPGGLIENGPEFIAWYESVLLPAGVLFLEQHLQMRSEEALAAIKTHVQLCYDVCHFAVGFEEHKAVIEELKQRGIRTGKIQISAALKAALPAETTERKKTAEAFSRFNEPTYLHQVIARLQNGSLKPYNDLPDALNDIFKEEVTEWRSHFHVPIFVNDFGLLQSTQEDIEQVLALQQQEPFTAHLEIETYTWEVLPDELKLPIEQSIIRELAWVLHFLANDLTATHA